MTVETGIHTVAKGSPNSGDQRFPLEPGIALSHKVTLSAIQQMGATRATSRRATRRCRSPWLRQTAFGRPNKPR
jgi:hypothetical protein